MFELPPRVSMTESALAIADDLIELAERIKAGDVTLKRWESSSDPITGEKILCIRVAL